MSQRTLVMRRRPIANAEPTANSGKKCRVDSGERDAIIDPSYGCPMV